MYVFLLTLITGADQCSNYTHTHTCTHTHIYIIIYMHMFNSLIHVCCPFNVCVSFGVLEMYVSGGTHT